MLSNTASTSDQGSRETLHNTDPALDMWPASPELRVYSVPTQLSVSRHTAYSVSRNNLVSTNIKISDPSYVSLSSQVLDASADNFVPGLTKSSGFSRDMDQVLKDHSEVERVLLGGVGTTPTSTITWQSAGFHSSSLNTQLSAVELHLPFAGSEIPSGFVIPAKPVVRTGTLKEFGIKYGNTAFTDRCLPPSEKVLTAHPRFTTAYYVALHNLVANPGHDGNGFWYPANTPNYKGARIPLAHTGLNVKSWRTHLIGYGDASELLQFMEFGFPLGLVDSPDLSPCQRNHGSAYQYYPHLDKFVSGEIMRGGLTGPFETPPWSSLMISPLMTAPKKPDSRRPVFDATFGDKSLNNATPSDHYLGTPTLYTYPRIDDFKKIILICGKGCFMWKRDLQRFYLQLPLDPVEYQHVGCVWRGVFFFFVALMFGLRHSGLQGQKVTDALSWIHRRSGLETEEESMFHCINYCDDLGGAEPTEERACLSFSKLGQLLPELGLAESTEKARAPSREMVYLGVLFNSESMTMSIPPDKLAEVKDEIERWHKKTTAVKKPFQSLLGKLFWVSRVVQHSRTFMGRLLTQLREMSGKPENMKVQLSEDCKKDLLWWRTFIKEYNGITMIENDVAVELTLHQQLDTPFTVCVGDATLSGGGAWHGSSYWSRQFPLILRNPKIPVHVKEFLVVIASIKVWGNGWSGTVVQIFCDNDPVCDVISGERPSDPKMLSLLREFKYWACKFRFYPVMRKIATKENCIADFISRRHDDVAAQSVFADHGIGHMTLLDAPDRLFDMTAPW